MLKACVKLWYGTRFIWRETPLTSERNFTKSILNLSIRLNRENISTTQTYKCPREYLRYLMLGVSSSLIASSRLGRSISRSLLMVSMSASSSAITVRSLKSEFLFRHARAFS